MNKFYKSNFNLKVILLFLLVLGQSGLLSAQTCTATVTGSVGLSTQGNVIELVYGNGVYVAVGSRGAIYMSTDGKVWSTAKSSTFNNTAYAGLAFGNGRFVAAGGNGTVVTSTDGINWTLTTLPGLNPLGKVAFGNNMFITMATTGGMSYRSTDGVNWTATATGGVSNTNNITFGNGKFIAGESVSTGSMGSYSYTSIDGITWVKRTITTSNANLNRLTYINDRFWTFHTGGIVFSSADGVAWAQLTDPIGTGVAGTQVFGGIWDGSKYLFMGSVTGNASAIWTSSTGSTFTLQTKSVAMTALGAAFANNRYFMLGSGSPIAYSDNATDWFYATADQNAMVKGGGKYVTVGNVGTFGGQIMTSTDFANWTKVPIKNIPSLFGVVYANSKFTAVGEAGSVLNSVDGTIWSAAISGFAGRLNSVVHAKGLYVAAGVGGITRSTNGINWVSSFSGTQTFTKVKFINNQFVAVGSNRANSVTSGAVFTSADGITWTDATPTTSAATPAYFTGIAWNGTQYLLTGLERTTGVFLSMMNTDLSVKTNYTDILKVATYGSDGTRGDLVYEKGVFVSAANSLTTPFSTVVLTSKDGKAWTTSDYVNTNAVSPTVVTAIFADANDFKLLGTHDGRVAAVPSCAVPAGPAVASVSIPANGTYKVGETLSFTVNASEAVTVVGGVPTLPLTIGTAVVNATYVSGSGTSALVFTYTLRTGDMSTNGIAIGSALALNGSTIKNSTAVDMSLALNAIGSTVGIVVDGVAPTAAITTMAVSPVLTTATIPVTVTFSEVVTGFTAADVIVANGALTAFSGSGTTYTFNLTPTAIGAVTIDIAAGGAVDGAGNANTAATQFSIFTFTPTITTVAATNIAATSATLGGNLVSATGAAITERGIVYGTALNPTTASTKVATGTTAGAFSAPVTALTTNQVYHFRAYVTYGTNTVYGDDLTVTPGVVNNPPVITSTGIATAVENVAYSYAIAATDIDSDPLTITATTKPAWLTIVQGASSGSAVGTATPNTSGVAADAAGNLYIAELSGANVYKISPAGVKTVFATKSRGSSTYNVAINGNYLYIGYYTGSCSTSIKRINLTNPAAGEELVLNNATLGGGMGMAFKDGYMYFSAYACSKIGRVNLTTLQSSDYIIGVPSPWGLDFAENGDLYVATWANRTVIKYAAGTTTSPTTVLNGFSGYPTDVKVDKNGYVYVSFYSGSEGVRRYTKDFSSFVTVGSGGIMGLALSGQGTLSYMTYGTGQAYKLETGAVLSGTPTHADVGDHPVVINVTDGKANVQQSFTINVTDPNPPIVTTFSPANNAIDVSLAQNMILTFNETVVKGTGNIVIKNVSNDAVVETIDVTSNKVTITNDNVVTINPAADFVASGNYYVTIDAGALKDASANAYGGIIAKTAFTFKTILNQAPIFSSTAVTTVNENVAYSYSVTATDADSDPLTFTATNLPSWLTFTQTGNVANLTGTPTHADVGNNSVVLNVYDGKTNVTQSFTIVVADVTAPTVTAFAPLNNAVDVALAQNIVLTFSENVVKGTGNIVIKKVADNAVVETIAVTSAQVNLANNVVTIDPAANLVAGNQYYLTVDATALKDPSSNAYAGISTNATLSFRTIKAASVINFAAQSATYGTADFTPVYSSTSTATSVTFTSGDNSVATIVANKVHIIKAGTVSITASQDGDLSYNAATPVTQTMTINALPLTVTAQAATKVYGAAEPTLNYTLSAPLKGSDVLTGALSRVAGPGVGLYDITLGTLANANYTLTLVSAKVTVTPKTLTVTATAGQSKVYGAANPVYAYTPDLPLATGNAFVGALARTTGEAVGTNYAMTAGTLSAGANYSITFVPANFAITAKPIVVTATAGQSKVYGSVDPVFVYTVPVGSLVGTDAFAGALARATGEHVGTAYAINQGTLTAGNNYMISFVPANFSITAKPITVAATAGQSKIYGAADPVFAYTTATGALVNDDTFSGVLIRASGENVDAAYAISQGSLTAGADYTITYTGANFAITAKPIAIAATVGQSKVYGEADPVFTYGITAGALVGVDKITGALTRVAGESIGIAYAINQGTLTAGSNYTLTYTPANFSITSKAITVVADAGQTKIYGTADPIFTYSITAGNLTGTDKITGALTRDAGEDIGSTYAINQGSLTAGANYTITYKSRDFGIMAKSITVTANASQAKVYGTTDPALTYSITSGTLVGGDKISGTLSRATGENIGITYAINQNTLTAGNNYMLTYVGANFSITAKPIVVAARGGQTKVYGTADPVFAYTASTLLGSDVFTGSLSRSAGESIGNAYAINQGTLTAGTNYTITYTGTNFSITPKAVVATAVAKTKVYGAGDPVLTYTFAPALVGGDSFIGALSRVSGEPVNTYAINQGTLTLNNNYTLTFAPGTLTITKKALVITADNKEKFAGTANPELTGSFVGFVTNETRSVLTTQPAIFTDATTASPIGTYAITTNGAAAANYSISYVNGTLTIKPAAPTSVALAGVAVFENSAVGTSAGTLSSTSDDPAGTFTYSLVNGSGDTDNSLFRIVGSRLQTSAALDYESKVNYSVRIRSTTQYGFSLDKVFTVALTDVNEIPTIAAIANRTICYTINAQSVALTGVTAGPEAAQTVALTVSSTNAGLFDALTVTKGNGTAGTLTYRVKNGVTGTATVTVTVRDNGGVDNGGVDVTTRTFTITVNAMPVVAISSNKGLSISKGETVVLTATGGVTYSWRNIAGVVGGQNTASLIIRPDVTATYEVTATNASGCSEVQTIRIEVLSDYIAVKATNIMSPNGDGKNDFFVIENIDKYPGNELKVFDRAGRIIFSKKGYDNSFDAMIKGSPLNEGTYYYIIDFGPDQLKKKGFITVIRDN